MSDASPAVSKSDLDRHIKIARRVLGIKQARENLIPFAEFMMPHPDDPDDAGRSMYKAARHHRVIAAALEEVMAGTIPRLIVTLPPRHGKSELVDKKFIPWYMANHPYASVIFATYNDEFAEDFGADIRNTIEHPAFKQIFPQFGLRKGGSAKGRLQTNEGGLAVFVGRGGSITGRGADLLIIDDIIKDAEEAESPTIREKCWEWFTKVAMTRLMTLNSAVVIVMTRWHEDDIVGRLTDPTNPCYSLSEAKKWKVIDLPALALPGDPLGREIGTPLWPERFDIPFLEAQRTLNPRAFSALYQQRPSPEDGDFFKREMIRYYDPKRIHWKDMNIYVASDHAVGKSKTRNDQSVMIVFGVDEMDNIYIVDCWHGREDGEVAIERMLDFVEAYKPLAWYAEKTHITQSLGPFIRKRMVERNVYTMIEEMTPAASKEQRAQSIRGRMSMGKVFFPRQKPWTNEIVEELMKFPNGKHDDFVDVMAYIGLKLQRQYSPSGHVEEESSGPKVGTLEWVKKDAKYRSELSKMKGAGELI